MLGPNGKLCMTLRQESWFVRRFHSRNSSTVNFESFESTARACTS